MRKLLKNLKAHIDYRRDQKHYYTAKERERMEGIMKIELERVERHYMDTIEALTRQHKQKMIELHNQMQKEMRNKVAQVAEEKNKEIRELKRELKSSEEKLQNAKKAYMLWRDNLEEMEMVTTLIQSDAKSALDTVASVFKRFSSFHDTVESVKRVHLKRENLSRELLEIDEEDHRPLVRVLTRDITD